MYTDFQYFFLSHLLVFLFLQEKLLCCAFIILKPGPGHLLTEENVVKEQARDRELDSDSMLSQLCLSLGRPFLSGFCFLTF